MMFSITFLRQRWVDRFDSPPAAASRGASGILGAELSRGSPWLAGGVLVVPSIGSSATLRETTIFTGKGLYQKKHRKPFNLSLVKIYQIDPNWRINQQRMAFNRQELRFYPTSMGTWKQRTRWRIYPLGWETMVFSSHIQASQSIFQTNAGKYDLHGHFCHWIGMSVAAHSAGTWKCRLKL
jgi:hypothetical protein